MSFKSKADKIRDRTWTEIKSSWIASIPNIPNPGDPPVPGLSDLLFAEKVHQRVDDGAFVPDVPGMRSMALWEAIFLFHKAGNIMSVSQNLVGQGYTSWSNVDGYHSAYIGARSLLAILGVITPQPEGQYRLLDLFPKPKVSRRRRSTRSIGGAEEPQFVSYRVPQPTQEDIWYALERTLRVSTVSIWNDKYVEHLRNTRYDTKSKRRNRVLYRNNYWEFDDLLRPNQMANFCDPTFRFLDTENILDDKDIAYPIKISFLIFRLCHDLLSDLAKDAPVLNSEFIVYTQSTWDERNAIYRSLN